MQIKSCTWTARAQKVILVITCNDWISGAVVAEVSVGVGLMGFISNLVTSLCISLKGRCVCVSKMQRLLTGGSYHKMSL